MRRFRIFVFCFCCVAIVLVSMVVGRRGLVVGAFPFLGEGFDSISFFFFFLFVLFCVLLTE